MAVNKPDKKLRQLSAKGVEDPSAIDAITYNEASGAVKTLVVGPFLKPLNDGAGGFTTNATAAKSIRKGSSIAIYNTGTTTVQSVTFGDDSALAALAAGATDVNGKVGYPCGPREWSYFNSNEKSWIRTNSADLLVFIIEDETYITSQRQ